MSASVTALRLSAGDDWPGKAIMRRPLRHLTFAAVLAVVPLTVWSAGLVASGPVTQSRAHIDSPRTVLIDTAGAAQPTPDQNLPPGAIKHPGEKCATTIQPPDGQSCVQSDDLHCSGTNRDIAQCMAARRGWFDGPNTGNQWTCLDHRWGQIESGYNVYAANRDGAYGVPQSLPGSKMNEDHVEVPGGGYHGDWHSDPYQQEAWGDFYIYSRYGSPCGTPWNGGY